MEPEEDKDNASGEPDVDGLRIGDRGESLLGLHALGLENIIEEWRKFQSFLFQSSTWVVKVRREVTPRVTLAGVPSGGIQKLSKIYSFKPHFNLIEGIINSLDVDISYLT